jgi:hypothetical protein
MGQMENLPRSQNKKRARTSDKNHLTRAAEQMADRADSVTPMCRPR